MKTNTDLEALSGISNEAIIKATEHDWVKWMDYLDSTHASDLPHKEIVALLQDDGGLGNAWWGQTITNTYEKYIGRRKTGEMETGFQIGVQKSFSIPLEDAWELITSAEGMKIWLGDAVKLEEKAVYETKDGITGEIRIFKPDSHIRMTWKLPDWDKESTLQLRVIPKANSTAITFHQEGLKKESMREEMRQFWKEKLKLLSEFAGQ
ncbi:uncharacterized protein YndB with AHSA1/START domain [Methanohalophilus levihalophilus]|uniref:SRPBCC domain-containing protein n=1 Tax=Methanohalophilus levihalophilus TaxID=1431282 RepID=UPI001AEA8DE4|nr:SRPBCC domain-containing protein [Methanohalophilus levihalophilus]MBP2031159.1 uncharacterized protein YndB with AHSA1/START domain [Methanohalophilus levihalophilus]